MVGKGGSVEVDKETFIKLSSEMGADIFADKERTIICSSGTDVKAKLENGKILNIKFMQHSSLEFSFSSMLRYSLFSNRSFEKDIYKLYFDIND